MERTEWQKVSAISSILNAELTCIKTLEVQHVPRGDNVTTPLEFHDKCGPTDRIWECTVVVREQDGPSASDDIKQFHGNRNLFG
jgi:hypothetical protein